MVKIYDDAKKLGKAAAEKAAEIINDSIREKGYARIVLSTGASQFTFFEEFVRQDIDFSKVEMFHLDEYIGIGEEHPASFCRYLKERFTSKVRLKNAYFIDGTKNPQQVIKQVSAELLKAPVNLGLIGIGENAHIAFNDPPADFDDNNCYKIVNLDEKCKRQQVGEGWFKSVDDVCKQAITMTCKQIMKCENIISVVPYKVKAEAVKAMLENELTPNIPATLLKQAKSFTLMLDIDSAALIKE
ncbi:MAG: 6-phosphogluconolactonase [Clostridia bacterium]|nr:6-phosphogluconolactonase [Clostridia bacterium]